MRYRIVRKIYVTSGIKSIGTIEWPLGVVSPSDHPWKVEVIFTSPEVHSDVTEEDLKRLRDTDMGFDIDVELSQLPSNMTASFELQIEKVGTVPWTTIGHYDRTYHLAKPQ